MSGTIGKKYIEGVAYECVIHLDYCRMCSYQTPIAVWWLYNKPFVGPAVGDYNQRKERQNELRERDRHRYHTCALCGWERWLTKTKALSRRGIERVVCEERKKRREAQNSRVAMELKAAEAGVIH